MHRYDVHNGQWTSTLVDMFVCACLAEHMCTYLERQCMHSLACSPAERITVEHGMIFGVKSDMYSRYI